MPRGRTWATAERNAQILVIRKWPKGFLYRTGPRDTRRDALSGRVGLKKFFYVMV